jgi:hypothetical protein
MILSQGKYPFGTIITRMRDDDVDFVVSTAKEGILKGLTTCIQLPTGRNAIKIFYMPSMSKEAIHLIHKQFVESVEENLKANGHLAVILVQLAESLRASGYTQEVVVDYGLKEFVSRLQDGQ